MKITIQFKDTLYQYIKFYTLYTITALNLCKITNVMFIIDIAPFN